MAKEEEVDGKQGRLGVDVKVLSVLASEVISKWAKSDIAICRFVSRAWRSVTWTGEFYRKYRNNQPVTINECKVAVYDPSDKECDSFGFCTYSLGDKLPPAPSEGDISDLPPEFSILASLDGMLVLAQRTGIRQRAYVKLLIYNPLTLWARELPPLPDLYLSSRSDPVGFYIDPDDGFDYKVLCLSLSDPYGAFVFSHRRRSWTAVEFDHDELLNHPGETLATWSPSTPTTWGQRLYFNLSYDDCNDDKGIGRGRGRIICFDVRTETFSQTPFPRPKDAEICYSSSLAVVDGRLHLYVTCHATDDLPLRVHVWKLKADVGAVVDDRDWVNMAYIEGPSPLHRVCTEPAGNWVAVLDEGDNSFEEVGAEDFKARYRRLLHPTYTYGRNRVIYVPSVVRPCPPARIE